MIAREPASSQTFHITYQRQCQKKNTHDRIYATYPKWSGWHVWKTEWDI